MGPATEPTATWWRQEGDRRRGGSDATGALLAYGHAVALDPFMHTGWLGMGLAFEALGCQDEALDRYHIATALAPHSFAAHEAKGLLLHARAAFEQALACFEWLSLVADGRPASAAWALNYRAATLLRMERADEALACCDAGLTHSPLDVLWLTRGNALRDLGRLDEAIVSHDRALALDPTCGEARFNRALVEEDQGRRQDACRTYRQCLEMSVLDDALEQRVRERLARAVGARLLPPR